MATARTSSDPSSIGMSSPRLRVCYFGTYRQNYSRNRILIKGLRQSGVEVIECHEQLWAGIEDRVQSVRGGWKSPRFWLRLARVYARLVKQYRTVGDYDVLVVGYPGQFDVFLARVLSALRGKPLVWDIFMSVYLISIERQLQRQAGFVVGLLRLIERMACRLPDRLVIDTAAYAEWFVDTHGIPKERFRLVPTGADTTLFSGSGPGLGREDSGKFQVLYYGTFIPNHGVDTILEAARLLADDSEILFVLVGDGPDRALAEAAVRKKALDNVRFRDWMRPKALISEIRQAHLCLGVFGETPQSLMTVQNKIYECLALGKPVLTGESAALAEAFTHGQHLYTCERKNPAALAQAIRFLKSRPQLRRQMAAAGQAAAQERYSVEAVGETFKGWLEEAVCRRNQR